MRLLANMCFVAPIFAHVYQSKPLPFSLKNTFTSKSIAKSTYRFLKRPLKNSPKSKEDKEDRVGIPHTHPIP